MITLRKSKAKFVGCKVLTKVVHALGEVDPCYSGWLELAQRLALQAGKGQKYTAEQRACEIIQFAARDCIGLMAKAVPWSCPALEKLQALEVDGEDSLSELADLVSEVNLQFLRRSSDERVKVQGATAATPEWTLAESILMACLFAGGSVRLADWTESQLGTCEMTFSFLATEAGRRNPTAERAALRKIRTRFIRLLERLAA